MEQNRAKQEGLCYNYPKSPWESGCNRVVSVFWGWRGGAIIRLTGCQTVVTALLALGPGFWLYLWTIKCNDPVM